MEDEEGEKRGRSRSRSRNGRTPSRSPARRTPHPDADLELSKPASSLTPGIRRALSLAQKGTAQPYLLSMVKPFTICVHYHHDANSYQRVQGLYAAKLWRMLLEAEGHDGGWSLWAGSGVKLKEKHVDALRRAVDLTAHHFPLFYQNLIERGWDVRQVNLDEEGWTWK